MDVSNGRLYASREDAIAAGVPEERVVEIFGTPEAAEKVSEAMRRMAQAVAEAEAAKAEGMRVAHLREEWRRRGKP